MTASQLQSEFRRLASDTDAVQLARFFKTGPGQYGAGDHFLGIRVPVIRKFAKRHLTAIRLSTVLTLLQSAYHEERLLALVMLVYLFERGDDILRGQVYELYLAHTDRINNWDLVDLSAPNIVGQWLIDRPQDTLYELAASPMLWERRIAIVATLRFIRGNDYEATLKIAEILLADQHDLIHKAVGWMLREVGKRDTEIEEQFLRRYADRMPRTMLRYAIERFPEDLRQSYLQIRRK